MLLGIACVVLGIVLITKPFTSLSVLAILVAISFLATGISELASAGSVPVPWLFAAAGLAWIGVGVAALVWVGLTIPALAILAGISLIVGGAVKVASGMRGDTDIRAIAVLGGLASIVFGALALQAATGVCRRPAVVIPIRVLRA